MPSNELIRPEASDGSAFTENMTAVVVLLAVVALALRNTLVAAVDQAERRYIRGEKLAAYRRRASWKKSDISNLKTLDLNPVAQRRMARLSGTGRPVVAPHRPLELAIVEKLQSIQPLFDQTFTAADRKRAIKHWPYWEHHVEALYRGECDLARKRKIKGPATHAEELVATELGLSAPAVHAICGRIRLKRKERDGAANFPAMTLTEYKEWMETGNLKAL